MSSFAAYEPAASGKPPAKVLGGYRGDDDDDDETANNYSPTSGSLTDVVPANTHPQVRYGKCVALVKDPGALCCGRIGISGNVFCGELASNQKTCPGSHENKLVALEARKVSGAANLYFMTQTKSKIKLHLNPVLVADGMDPAELEELLNHEFEDLGEWMKEVEARNEAMITGEALDVVRSTIKKPSFDAKLYEDVMDDATRDLATMFQSATVNSPAKLKDVKPSADQLTEGGWMSQVNAYLDTAATSASNRLGSELESLRNKLGLLETRVGTPGAPGPRAGQSLWEALDNLSLNVGSWLQEPSKVKELRTAVFSSPDLIKYLESTKKAIDSVTDRVSKLEISRRNQSAGTAPSQSVFANYSVGAAPPSIPAASGDPTQADAIQKLSQKVAELERSKNGNTSRGEITVVFKDKVFTSMRDVRGAFKVSATSTDLVRPSLVHDAYTIFDLVADEVFGYPEERKIAPDKAQRLNRSIKDLRHIHSSTLNGLPNFFDGSKSSKVFMDGSVKGSKSSVFANIKSHDMWGPIGTPHNCVRDAAERALDSIKLEYLNNPKEGVDPATGVLLDAMLVRSIEFVKAVFSFLTKEYETLKLYFSEGDKCWNFLCNCVKQVFSSEFHVARSVSRSADYADQQGTNEKVIWTALRTISIQEDFLRVGFENHAGLSSAYSRFMLTNMPNKAVTKLQAEMESSLKKLKSVEEGVKKVEGLANSAISKAAAAGGMKQKQKKDS